MLLMYFRFYDRRDAEEALDSLDGRMLDGRELRVQMARYGRPSSPYRSRYDRRKRFVSLNVFYTMDPYEAHLQTNSSGDQRFVF